MFVLLLLYMHAFLQVQEFQYWTLYPAKKALQIAQVLEIMNDGKPAEKCPETQVVLTTVYEPHGKTSLLQATTDYTKILPQIQKKLQMEMS